MQCCTKGTSETFLIDLSTLVPAQGTGTGTEYGPFSLLVSMQYFSIVVAVACDSEQKIAENRHSNSNVSTNHEGSCASKKRLHLNDWEITKSLSMCPLLQLIRARDRKGVDR